VQEEELGIVSLAKSFSKYFSPTAASAAAAGH